VFCSKCGGQNVAHAAFCQKCGVAMPAAIPVPAVAVVPAPAYTYAAAPAARYGGFWIRFLAFIIDGIIVRVVTAPFAILLAVMGIIHRRPMIIRGPLDEHDAIAMAAASLAIVPLLLAVNWLYEALLTSSSWQATVGKKVLSLKVTDEAGNRISFARASGRYFAKILSSMLLFIGYIMAAFTERKRALHDMLAGTVVRRG
jgi:uncharacterized RDD family membrane protein YckC